MANGIFGFGPMGVLPETPANPEEKRRSIEGIATKHKVPANVLMALDEAGVSDTETAAQKIAADMSGGKTIDQIVGPDLMNRAYDIADKIYPRQSAPAPAPVAPTGRPKEANVLRDLPAAVGSSVAGAAGSVLRGVGEGLAGAADAVTEYVANPVIEGLTGQKDTFGKAPNPLEAPAQALGGNDGLKGFLDSYVSEDVKRDIANLTDPNADLFDPNTWKMGPRPTVRGTVYSAIDVFGSMAPVVIVGALTRSPAAAAAAGGAMSAGDAASNASTVIDAMAAKKLPDGRSQLEAESSVYQRLIGAGIPADEAFRITKRRAEQQSALFAAIPGALGGAATQKILSGAEGIVAGLPWGGRVAATAAMSGAEEGTQEVAEGIAGRTGINTGAGVNQSVTAGTLNEGILGALGGGPMGAIGGAFSHHEPNTDTIGDGSANGQDAAPDLGLPGPVPGAVPAYTAPPPPSGPIGRVAAAAPDLTPQPEAPAPSPFFPDQKAGVSVRLFDPEAGIIRDAVFLGEGPDGVSVRLDGGEIFLTPEEFDKSRNDASRMDAEAKVSAKGDKKKSKGPAKTAADAPAFDTDPEKPYESSFDAAAAALKEQGYGADVVPAPEPVPGSLSQQALSAVTPPAEAAPKASLAPDEALARAKQIEDTAKETGWNKRLTKQHADFMAIAHQGGATNEPVLDNGTGSVAPVGADGIGDRSRSIGSEGTSSAEGPANDSGGSPIIASDGNALVGATPASEPSRPLAKDDQDLAKRQHAANNAIINDVLPGRQAKGVPMASLTVGPNPDGGFMVRPSMTTATGGFSSPMDGAFATADEALQMGAEQIRSRAEATLKPDALKNGYNEQDQADARKILKWLGDRGGAKPKPHEPMAPMVADPSKRMQPDMLGGREVTETEMAKKERTRREWGKFVGIAEHGKSSDDMELEGRQVILRPGKVIVRARLDGKSDQDRIIDTAGLSRDDIAAATRGAFRELDRISPIEVSPPTTAQAAHPKPPEPVKPEPVNPKTKVAPTIQNIREKAAVLRGVPKDSPPEVEGVSLKWDAKEDGFIFSRKQVDRVRAAVGLEDPAPQTPATATALDPYPALTVKALYGDKEQTLYNTLPNGYRAVVDSTGTQISDAEGNVLVTSSRQYSRDEIVQYAQGGAAKAQKLIGRNARGNDVFEDKDGVRSYVDGGIRVTEPIALQPRRDGSLAPSFNSSNRSSDFKTEVERQPAPTAAEVKAAASEANPNPTEAQKEAGNYQMGHIMWNGLDISIETAKGALRSGKDSDGEIWSVKMPAHYGYIKRTQGADGDHVDVYLGPKPKSASVFVVDQVDAATGAFDEHKVMLGFETSEGAQAAYVAGFSDGKGKNRMGAITPMTVDQFKATIADKAVWDKPLAKDEVPAHAKPAGLKGLSDAENAKMAELQARFKAKINSQINSGLDPELVTIAVQMGALYVKSGVRRFRALVDSMMNDIGLTLEQAQPYARNAYNQIRGDMELEGDDITDMDSDADVIAEVRKMRSAEAKSKADAAPSPQPTKSDTISPEPANEAKNDLATDASVFGASTEKSQGAEREGAAGGGVGGERRAEKNAGKLGTERDAGIRSERGIDAEGADILGRTGGADGELSQPTPKNHVIQVGELEVKAGEKTRAKNSVEAIRVLRALEKEGRPATEEERQKLALYGGAGTLAAALPRSDGTIRFADLAEDLDKLLDDEEKRTLSRTSQYAFYTSEVTLRSMWALAQRLGFDGGRIYEPGMGVGGFAGTMPEALRGYGKYTGLELDHVTAKIAAALYPEHSIKQGDFIKEKLPNDYYDLVIGNPPFAGIKIQADPDYPQGFMLHDYFFAKSLDALRPGGVLMFVTSAGTLNKMDSMARDYLADRADLLGAIRLPNTAFKENGTEVTTDIIVMRKRLPGETEANPAWRNSDVIEVPDADGGIGRAAVNRYFIEHPEMILGEQGLFDTLTASDRIGVKPLPGSDFKADLIGAVNRFAPNAISEATPAQKLDVRDGAAPETKTGGYYLKNGELWQFNGRVGVKIDKRSKENPGGPSKADHELIQELVPLKLALRDLYAADVNGTNAAPAARAKLNAVYDAFVAKRGPINLEIRSLRRPSIVEQETARLEAYEDARAADSEFDRGSFDPGPMLAAGASMSEIARARKEARDLPGYEEGDFNPDSMPDKIIIKRPNIEPFEDDPESFRLRAIEKYDSETDTAKKTRVFTESAVTLSVAPKIASPEDALLFLLADTGKVDLDRIAELSKSSPSLVRDELGGKIFKDPTNGQWETRAKYLSGNVRKKLREAQLAAKEDASFEINMQSLEQVQPAPVVASEIRVPIGAHWFPSILYSDWAKTLGLHLTVDHKKSLGLWVVDGSNTDAKSKNEFGTGDLPFADLMRRVMNNKSLKVSRTTKNADGTTTTFVDDEATQAATDKAAELREKFSEWFWSDEDRSREMEALYNEVFNAEVAPKYDGGYLTTPGIHSDWGWRPHQTSVIARILQTGSTYIAHTVGAGKTSAMIGAVMEARRLGIWKKPMIAVPNHMLVQFATEFYQQYPLANILVADEKRFHTSARKQFIADVALGDWDAIIITHSAFGKIPASERAKREAVRDMLDDIQSVLEDSGKSNDRAGDRGGDMATERSILGALQSIAATLGVKVDKEEKGVSTRKKIERLMEAAEQRMSRQVSDVGKDQVFDFDELGVDSLLLDEAHLFRKLSFATGLGSIKGIDPAGSMASMDLYVKTRALEKANPGRSLVMASGTPITNTMAEAYTISRYLQPQALADRGMSAFDAWAGTFGQVDSALEQTPDGGYKEVSRFAKFVNTPELSLMIRQVMDVVSGTDLEKYVTRPKLKGGKRNLVVIDASSEVKAYQADLGSRMRKIENRKGPVQKGDDILLSVINDGRMSAIDMRLVDPSALGHGSKLERMISNIFRVWKAGENAPLYGVKKEGGYTAEPIMHGPTAQIVFSTLGINGSKNNPSFMVHRFIKSELIRMGVPAAQIVLSEDLKTHAQKQNAFGDINEGKKRILIGSKSLFTGVNAQRRLVAIHNLDPLWFPADDEQRNGRGIRQGNMNPEIEIFDYSTKGTYDATMWQMMGRKASFIEGFFRGDPDMREIEDLGEASAYEQAKAMSTADPRILELTDMKAERDKLQRRKAAISTQRDRLAYEINRQGYWKGDAQNDIDLWTRILPQVKDLSGDKFEITLNGQTYTKRTDAGNALIGFAADSVANADTSVGYRKVGAISGFPILMRISLADQSALFHVELTPDHMVDTGFSDDPVGMMRRFEGAVSSVEDRIGRANQALKQAARKQEEARQSLANIKDFAEGRKLSELQDKISELEATLRSENAPTPKEKESRFENSKPVATLTGNELGPWEDIRQLGKKAEAWYRENLIGTTVVNAATGIAVQFRREGAKKVSGRKGDVLLRIVPALRKIIELGQRISTEADTKGNPDVAAWHTISATVILDGSPRDIVVKVKETREGNFHYDLSRDVSDGARHMVTSGRDVATAIGLEDNPVSLNLDFAPQKINRAELSVPVAALRAISDALAAEMKTTGLDGKVSPALVRTLLGRAGVPIQGRQIGAQIQINAAAADPIGVLRHEIIHALRDASLWSKPYGLFTRDEWQSLVSEARKDAELMARVKDAYDDLSETGQIEEAVAEMYREWAEARSASGIVTRAFNKIVTLFRALASALRGQGFMDAALVMERIAAGQIGGRGPDGSGPGRGSAEMRPQLLKAREKFSGLVGSRHWKNPGAYVSNLVTDAMAGKGDYSALALVPGRAMFAELGKKFKAANAYLRSKEEMDALRNDWHARADKVAQRWLALRNKMPDVNDGFMDLMHRSTLAGIDPSKEDDWKHAFDAPARREVSKNGDKAPDWAKDAMRQIAAHEQSYSVLRQEFEALPKEFQQLYKTVLSGYDLMAERFEKAVLNNIQNATRIGLKRAIRAHAKEIARIRDEGLEGEERVAAVDAADAALDAVKRRGGFSAKARIAALRKKFESNRLKGPYFPLARFGDYFVTVRDDAGAVVSFSRFEREAQQQAFIRELKESGETRIEFGAIDKKKKLRGQIDPSFVADIENMLAESGAGDEVMDAVWQRWLETLPDQSIRTSKIHRKGRKGFSNDAFRAFGKHMFHGAHQLARLEYGLLMEEHLNDAEDEARVSDNPNRAGLLVAEMRKRHDFTMNPSGSSAVASMSGAAFIWYLGASPAAALANISQTTVVGIPLMAARFSKAGVSGSAKALGKATKDFMAGRGAVSKRIAGVPVWSEQWTAENSPDLSDDERSAMREAVRRGTIDKTQAHDLASVAETGIEYNPTREKWMKRIGWFFHHAERFNREVTFLANYRLARDEGLDHSHAVEAAADITWKIHFDYQNTSRPRFMQNDLGKILTTFRQFTVNLIWRMFRDTHQMLNGATKEDRREARVQLVGVTLSMMAHAGIRGTWGYGLLMMLLGMLAPGADDDDIKEWLQDALLMEGDNPGVAAWNFAMGAALNGVPGQVLGVDLVERIGMPNLWFREAPSDLEGADLYAHYVGEVLGPVYGIGQGFFRGAQLAADGEWWRGTEAATPKVIRDAMKTVRYIGEGVQTINGDTILDGVSPYQALMQVSGFTPAKIAERYDINTRLKDRERQITDARRDIQKAAADAVLAGQSVPDKVMSQIRKFNSEYPEYPITGDTIRQSARGRIRAQDRAEFGVTLNAKLNDRLRAERAPQINN